MARLLIGANYSIGDYNNGDLIVKQRPTDTDSKPKVLVVGDGMKPVCEQIREHIEQTATKEKSCETCEYECFRETYSSTESPCDACYDMSHFMPKQTATKEGE